MTTVLDVVIDSRIRFPPGIPRDLFLALKKSCTHANPDFHKKKAMGFATWGVESSLATWAVAPDQSLSLPRGATARVRAILEEHGVAARWIDRRTDHGRVAWPKPNFTSRWYQNDAIERCVASEQGIVRAPTGSGKSVTGLGLLALLERRALVVVREGPLLKQWVDEAIEKSGLFPKEIGILKGSKLRVGARLTLALQQTLYSPKFPLAEVASMFDVVLFDECQSLAAVTFQRVSDVFTARYRIGLSADETRRDKKEFLVYDQLGAVIFEIEREELEAEKAITPVEVVLIPTDFAADWYRDSEAGERDFNSLLDEMISNEPREKILVDLIEHLSNNEAPALVFSHRIEHARRLSDIELFARGVRSGLLLGGNKNAVRFDEDKARLKTGRIPVCVGTYSAVGRGIDMPAVRAGVMATPIGANRQFFGQVRGRICRPAEGKETGRLYVLWDRLIWDRLPDVLKRWNGGRVAVQSIDEILSAT